LRAVREAHSVSLREMERRTGIRRDHLSRIERGERPLTVERLAAIAGALGMRDLVKTLRPFTDG